MRSSPRQLFDEFVANPLMVSGLANAHVNGSLNGYPLRFHFPTAQLAFPGLILIGESAGLVNPLTGEEIDYALTSAETLLDTLRHNPTAAEAAMAHTHAQRQRFQRTFITMAWLRDFYLRPWLLSGRWHDGRRGLRHRGAGRTKHSNVPAKLRGSGPAQWGDPNERRARVTLNEGYGSEGIAN